MPIPGLRRGREQESTPPAQAADDASGAVGPHLSICSDPSTEWASEIAALTHLIEQLAELPLQGGQIEPPVTPAAAVDLAQQPEPILIQLGDQAGRVGFGRL